MPGRQTTRLPLPRLPLVSLALLSAAIVALAAVESARADLIFLKDGFVLQGKVDREGKSFADPISGQAVWMPQGFYWVTDGARRIAFSPAQVQAVDGKDYNPEYDLLSPRVVVGQKYLPALREVVATGPWDALWDRKITVRCVTNDKTSDYILLQHLAVLTPHYAKFDTLGFAYRWSSTAMTSELGSEAVVALLAAHPDFKEKPEMNEGDKATRRFKMFHFLVQAGWYDAAEQTLDRIRKDLPGQQDKVDTALQNLKKLRTVSRADEALRARTAGQHALAQKRLLDLPEEGLPETTLREVRRQKVHYERSGEQLKQARRFLEELPKTVTDEALRDLFRTAARSILEELDADNVGRLAPFLSQAAQAERLMKQKQKPEDTPDELMALAVSGWLLDSAAAETKVDVAERFWRAREFALKYQQTQNQVARQLLLKMYLAPANRPIGVEELAQLIATLPPPEPEEKVGAGVHKLNTQLPGRRPVNYLLRLPPEYHPGRVYPVLIALHNANENAREMMDRWGELAGQHGYILAAPEWARGLGASYGYTSEEHFAVLDLLHDLRRRFWVNSDRIFLHGLGEGANMAYDVGLAHPDLFAGVIPMGGQPALHAFRYRRNGQYLPFYTVSGDSSGKPHQETRRLYEDWISKGHPSLFVERRGRGQEWFPGEMPIIFDWMQPKHRAMPMTEVGAHGREFQTLRTGDNSFYWASTDSINPSNLTEGTRLHPNTLAATLWGHIDVKENMVHLRTTGLRQATVWLMKAVDSQGKLVNIVNFNAPVTISVNGQVKHSARVVPSMETLLEELFQRGDRQRLILGRVDISKI